MILDALLDTDGDDFQIELNVQVSVGPERYEIPITPLLDAITQEAASIVDWFAPAQNPLYRLERCIHAPRCRGSENLYENVPPGTNNRIARSLPPRLLFGRAGSRDSLVE